MRNRICSIINRLQKYSPKSEQTPENVVGNYMISTKRLASNFHICSSYIKKSKITQV